jgi:hypothetical protein
MSTANAAPKCQYCGSLTHPGVCPTVKAIEYHQNGTVKRVEFKGVADYPPFYIGHFSGPYTGPASADKR